MERIIAYLQKEKEILELLKDQKISLVGVSQEETLAILEAYDEEDPQGDIRLVYWRNV